MHAKNIKKQYAGAAECSLYPLTKISTLKFTPNFARKCHILLYKDYCKLNFL